MIYIYKVVLSSAEACVMNSHNYHFEAPSLEIQVAKATNGQKNGSSEESILGGIKASKCFTILA